MERLSITGYKIVLIRFSSKNILYISIYIYKFIYMEIYFTFLKKKNTCILTGLGNLSK